MPDVRQKLYLLFVLTAWNDNKTIFST